MENIEKYFDQNTVNYMNSLDEFYGNVMDKIMEFNYNGYGNFIVKDQKEVEKIIKIFSVASEINIKKKAEEIFRNTTKYTIFYHSDLDGKSSGAIMYSLISYLSISEPNIHFVEYNYKPNDKMFDEAINESIISRRGENTTAIIVDLSIPKENMMKIITAFNNVIWMDHHITSISTGMEIFHNNSLDKNNLIMLLDTTISGAYIAYQFVKNYMNKVDMTPYGAKLISDYDTWNLKSYTTYQLGVFLNQYYFSMNTLDPTHPLWYRLLIQPKEKAMDALFEILSVGEKLYNIEQIKLDIMYHAEIKYRMKFQNYSFVAINGYGNSFRFTGIEDQNSIKILVRYNVNLREISVSAYGVGSELNLGTIFKKRFNGGGHPQAAGFNISEDKFFDIINGLKKNKNIKEPIYTQEGSKTKSNAFMEKIIASIFSVFVMEIEEQFSTNSDN